MNKISAYARRFDITSNMPRVLAMALGAGETTLMRLTSAYAMLVNGGRKIEPVFVDRIQDRYGTTLYRQDTRPCIGCNAEVWADQIPPDLPDTREEVLSAQTSYQVVSMLEGVVKRGTGRQIHTLGKPLAVRQARPMIIAMPGLSAFRRIWLSGYMSAMTITAHWGRMKQAGVSPLPFSGLL